MPIAFWFFIISFLALTTIVSVRAYELSSGQRLLEIGFIRKTDIMVHDFFHLLKRQISRISFKNIYRFIIYVYTSVRDALISLKKRYDSRQPKFFIKQTKNDITQNGSASFFLKNVAEYKDSIRKK